MSRGLRAPRWSLALVALTTLAVVAGAVALVVGTSRSGAPSGTTPTAHPDPAALAAYVSALRDPTARGGEVVEQEIKPSIAEVDSGQLAGPTLAARARSWKIAFARVRQSIDAIRVPTGLERAHELFDTALDAYTRVADLLLQAASATAPQRNALLDSALAAGRDADSAYDAAAALVQAALRAAGLPLDPNLPNPSATPR